MSTGMVILAGGIGKRMNRPVPKQFLLLGGKPIILHVLEKIEQIEEIEKVVICSPKEHIEEMQKLIFNHNIQKNILCVEGGKSRQESTYIGCKNLQGVDSIIVHEAVRPFVSKKEYLDLINDESENVIYGLYIPFTVLKQEDGYIKENLKRDELINVQLPQKFNGELLLKAHEDAAKEGLFFTEDASLFYHYNPDKKVRVLKGSLYNVKITTPVDLVTCEEIYKEFIVGKE